MSTLRDTLERALKWYGNDLAQGYSPTRENIPVDVETPEDVERQRLAELQDVARLLSGLVYGWPSDRVVEAAVEAWDAYASVSTYGTSTRAYNSEWWRGRFRAALVAGMAAYLDDQK